MDIFSPGVDTSRLPLDNEQWVLKNTVGMHCHVPSPHVSAPPIRHNKRGTGQGGDNWNLVHFFCCTLFHHPSHFTSCTTKFHIIKFASYSLAAANLLRTHCHVLSKEGSMRGHSHELELSCVRKCVCMHPEDALFHVTWRTRHLVCCITQNYVNVKSVTGVEYRHEPTCKSGPRRRGCC